MNYSISLRFSQTNLGMCYPLMERICTALPVVTSIRNRYRPDSNRPSLMPGNLESGNRCGLVGRALTTGSEGPSSNMPWVPGNLCAEVFTKTSSCLLIINEHPTLFRAREAEGS